MIVVKKEEIQFAAAGSARLMVEASRLCLNEMPQNIMSLEQTGHQSVKNQVEHAIGLVIPRDKICLDEELKVAAVDNSLNVLHGNIAEQIEISNKKALTVVHISRKAKCDMNNKTNLKRIDKENDIKSMEKSLGLKTSSGAQSMDFLHEGKATTE